MTQSFDFAQAPGHLIRRAHQIAVALFMTELSGEDVTPVQFAVLNAVMDTPGIDQVTLAGRVAFDAATSGSVIGRLETKGWIVRHILPRRQRSLHLTDEGTSLLAEMLPRVQAMYARILEPLSAPEQTELLRLLGKLTTTPEDPPSPTPDQG